MATLASPPNATATASSPDSAQHWTTNPNRKSLKSTDGSTVPYFFVDEVNDKLYLHPSQAQDAHTTALASCTLVATNGDTIDGGTVAIDATSSDSGFVCAQAWDDSSSHAITFDDTNEVAHYYSSGGVKHYLPSRIGNWSTEYDGYQPSICAIYAVAEGDVYVFMARSTRSMGNDWWGLSYTHFDGTNWSNWSGILSATTTPFVHMAVFPAHPTNRDYVYWTYQRNGASTNSINYLNLFNNGFGNIGTLANNYSGFDAREHHGECVPVNISGTVYLELIGQNLGRDTEYRTRLTYTDSGTNWQSPTITNASVSSSWGVNYADTFGEVIVHSDGDHYLVEYAIVGDPWIGSGPDGYLYARSRKMFTTALGTAVTSHGQIWTGELYPPGGFSWSIYRSTAYGASHEDHKSLVQLQSVFGTAGYQTNIWIQWVSGGNFVESPVVVAITNDVSITPTVITDRGLQLTPTVTAGGAGTFTSDSSNIQCAPGFAEYAVFEDPYYRLATVQTFVGDAYHNCFFPHTVSSYRLGGTKWASDGDVINGVTVDTAPWDGNYAEKENLNDNIVQYALGNDGSRHAIFWARDLSTGEGKWFYKNTTSGAEFCLNAVTDWAPGASTGPRCQLYAVSDTEVYVFFLATIGGMGSSYASLSYIKYNGSTWTNTVNLGTSAFETAAGGYGLGWGLVRADQTDYTKLYVITTGTSGLAYSWVDMSGTPSMDTGLSSATATFGYGYTTRDWYTQEPVLIGSNLHHGALASRPLPTPSGGVCVDLSYLPANWKTPTLVSYTPNIGQCLDTNGTNWQREITVGFEYSDTEQRFAVVLYGFLNGSKGLWCITKDLLVDNGWSDPVELSSYTATNTNTLVRWTGRGNPYNDTDPSLVFRFFGTSTVNYDEIILYHVSWWTPPPPVYVTTAVSVDAGLTVDCTPQLTYQASVSVAIQDAVDVGETVSVTSTTEGHYTLMDQAYVYGLLPLAITTTVTIDLTVPLMRTFEQHSVHWACGWTDEFTEIVNERRDYYGLPPFKKNTSALWTSGNREDTAQTHAKNMADLGLFEHEDPSFPAGYQTLLERLGKMGSGNGAENILLAPISDNYDPSDPAEFDPNNPVKILNDYTFVTPQAAFDAWWVSDIHRANILREFGGSEDVYLLVGLDHGTHTDYPDYQYVSYLCNVFVNLGIPEYATVKDRFFHNGADFNGALIEVIHESSDFTAYTDVRADHEAVYSTRIAVAHEAVYGTRVASSHVCPIHYSLTVAHTSPYTGTSQIVGDHEAVYRIWATVPVQQDHTALYGERVFADHVAGYEPLGFVSADHEAPYSESVVVKVEHEGLYGPTPQVKADHKGLYGAAIPVTVSFTALYDDVTPVKAGHEASYEPAAQLLVDHVAPYEPYSQITTSHKAPYDPAAVLQVDHVALYSGFSVAQAAHTAPYGLLVNIRGDHEGVFDLSILNPVRAAHKTFYSLQLGDADVLSPTASLVTSSSTIPIDDAVVSQSEDDFVWGGEVRLTDIADFVAMAVDEEVTLNLDGDAYAMVITSKNFSRSDEVDNEFRITLASPAVKFDLPRSDLYSYRYASAMGAKAIVEDILGESVNWEILDWVIPANRIQFDDVTPISAVQTIVASAGGIVQSEIDGTLTVRYLYPVSTKDYATATVDATFTDDQDNMSASQSYEFREGYNKFRVREGESSFQDVLDWAPDEADDSLGILRVYPSPWRSTFTVRTTEDLGTTQYGLDGLISRQETEIVEFTNGVASLQYPIKSLDAIDWMSESLGSVSFTQYSRNLSAPVTTNGGYGLAEITYTVDAYEYTVVGQLGTYVQFILEDD